ncbi:MAG: xanthine dehydrogenase family protein molybdopterin-binding subunit [Rhizobiales bacterium]|nr:xanthine dehydrogenase family protein molybdopterin-binding subunit [Hyphomicrobiales bacterium]
MVIGHSVGRLEDAALVTGSGRFVADMSLPHQLHMRLVRSPIANGRILGIDSTEALALPGVVAVWSGEDVADIPPVDFRDPSAEALLPYRQPVLARGRVRYVGEPVAIVFAADIYTAEDAADLVHLDIEPLPVLMSASDPPAEFDEEHLTEPTVLRHGFGDVERAFAEAHTVVELDLDVGRHSAVPMETRGAIGVYDVGLDMLRLYGAAKVPHRNRDTLARMLGRSPNSLHLHELHVGGGFGVRGELYPEDVLVCVAALRLRRPIKWIEDRREHLVATNHSRQQRHCARLAVDAEGHILAIEDEFFHDQGAYIRTHGARVMDRTLWSIPGPYNVPAYRGIGHFRLTNKTPAATYRAPGGYESSFVRERLLDVAAQKLGIDAAEIRRRNLIRPEQMPFRRAFEPANVEPQILDSGDYPGLFRRALEAIGFDALKDDIARRRAAGEAVGVGMSVFFDESGRGPSDGARATVDTNGNVELVTGGASLGQGFETVMAQICAQTLGVDYKTVRVIHGQTDRIAYGIGAHASRATVLTGNAVHATAQNLRQKALSFASDLLQTPADRLDIQNGQVITRDAKIGASISLAEIARRVAPGSPILGDRAPGLSAEGWYNTDRLAFSYGVHVALVAVDRETGGVSIERYVIAQEVGRAVNPMLVEGQVVGGCLQGIGGALYEEFVYSETGDPLAVTFADYLLPTVSEAPRIEVIVTQDVPSPVNPLGLRGAGEGGINGVGAAIANAVEDALQRSGAITRLPITPQRLMAQLNRIRSEA